MIPDKFYLGGKLYSVEYLDSIDDTGLGRAYIPLGVIKIAKKWQGNLIPVDSQQQTFYHELIHSILDELGYYEYSKDENFVQGFAALLHQYELTKTFDNE